MPELTPRVVFDCNLFVQGIANRNSPARQALRLFFNGEISLFVSEPIIREVRDVLNRPELRSSTACLTSLTTCEGSPHIRDVRHSA